MDRLWLTLGTLAFAAAVYGLMLKGWRSRQARQADVPAPQLGAAGGPTVLGPLTGLYVGTTAADDWLDRIAVHSLADRARGAVTVTAQGVSLERAGHEPLLLPLSDVRAASVETALAGKVVSSGMLVVTWRLGTREVATAFRADSPSDNRALRDAITALLPVEA